LALALTMEKLNKEGRALPPLLRRFCEKADSVDIDRSLLKDYNPKHNVPDEFLEEIKEMYELVASDN
ncbi:MAG: hypothetical protein ACI4SX_03450, partial [Candidatus Fimenecus sp.]